MVRAALVDKQCDSSPGIAGLQHLSGIVRGQPPQAVQLSASSTSAAEIINQPFSARSSRYNSAFTQSNCRRTPECPSQEK